jgi:hypothetical protein
LDELLSSIKAKVGIMEIYSKWLTAQFSSMHCIIHFYL